jgi:phosphotransferase system HPr-like phosphotransfer protein
MFWKRKPKPIIPKEFETNSKQFETKWRIGTRTAFIIAQLARRFSSDISVSVGQETFDAKDMIGFVLLESEADRQKTKSIMGLKLQSEADRKNLFWELVNSGPKAGSQITVTVRGPDATAAMEALAELLSCGSRVDHCVESGCPFTPMLSGYSSDRIDYDCSMGHTWSVSRKDAGKAQQSA